MRNIAKTLRDEYSHDELNLLLAKQNSGSFTYDGIERGGERVCAEIEDELRKMEKEGGKITKLSVIGYSLGGLVSRYAVGLLDAKGILDDVECMVSISTWLSIDIRLTQRDVIELCDLRKPSPWRPNPPQRLAQQCMEHSRRQDALHVRASALYNRQVPRHRPTFALGAC